MHQRRSYSTHVGTTYLHGAAAAGPVMFTDASGGVVEERRHEPFGAPVDSTAPSGGVDFAEFDFGVLNHPVDPTTGWSFHGARWFAPETARWLSIDPPTLEPSARFADEPWALHPYQYTDQNPVLFWDPDGNEKSRIEQVKDVKDKVGKGVETGAKIAVKVLDKPYLRVLRDTMGVMSILSAIKTAYWDGLGRPHYEARQMLRAAAGKQAHSVGFLARAFSDPDQSMKDVYNEYKIRAGDSDPSVQASIDQFNRDLANGIREADRLFEEDPAAYLKRVDEFIQDNAGKHYPTKRSMVVEGATTDMARYPYAPDLSD